MNKFLKVAWFAAKVGLGGGVVYVTVDRGVWGSSQTTVATYDKLYGTMPATKAVAKMLPKEDDMNVNFRSYWNKGVFDTFDFLVNLPSKVGSLKDSTLDLLTPAPTPAPAANPDNGKDKQEENGPKPEFAAVEEASPSPPSSATEEGPPTAVEVVSEGSSDNDKKEE